MDLKKTQEKQPVSHAEIRAAVRMYPRIILRGAGEMGQTILKALLSEGVEKEKFCFWDQKADYLPDVSGVPLRPAFSEEFLNQDALILHCIATELPYAPDDYIKRGYAYHMDGSALLCPYIAGTDGQMRACNLNPHCALIQCPRQTAQGIFYVPHRPNAGPSAEILLADKLTFSINTRCTLKCAHCIHYINHFPLGNRTDFPLARILLDMELACAAHDFIRIGVIQGGEPFLHPDFPRILMYLLSQSNVGMAQIFSNGVCQISEESMAVLQNERVHLRISSYKGALNQKQEALLEKNLCKLVESGISHTLYQVRWNLAPTLLRREYSRATLQYIKENCPCLPDSRLVIDGVYYPCHYAAYIALHDIADYAEDKLSLSPALPREALRARIMSVNERSYYRSCAHCDFSDVQVMPGEQGVSTRYIHINRREAHA
jgi:uncharacterized Fe-S cluster-containing radical SAM superfamily protein